jgi:hypothetical protein
VEERGHGITDHRIAQPVFSPDGGGDYWSTLFTQGISDRAKSETAEINGQLAFDGVIPNDALGHDERFPPPWPNGRWCAPGTTKFIKCDVAHARPRAPYVVDTIND